LNIEPHKILEVYYEGGPCKAHRRMKMMECSSTLETKVRFDMQKDGCGWSDRGVLAAIVSLAFGRKRIACIREHLW